MKRFCKKVISFVVVIAVIFSTAQIAVNTEVKGAGLPYMNYCKYTFYVGNKVQLKVVNGSGKAKWSSSNKKMATVSRKGMVTAKKPGKCTITARIGTKKYKCVLIIKEVSGTVTIKKFKKPTVNVLSLKLDINNVRMNSNGKAEFDGKKAAYNLKLLNAPKKAKIKWKSSNKNVAVVNKKGKVTAVAKGQCTVTATAKKKKYKCKVMITDLNDPNAVFKQKNIYGMLAMINRDRVKAKAAPLQIHEQINKVADLRSVEVSEQLSHQRPDGTSFSTAYDQLGIKKGSLIGENIAMTKDGIADMRDFLTVAYQNLYISKEHRKIILKPQYKYIGIGYYQTEPFMDNKGIMSVQTFWAQEFYTK